MKIGQPVMFSKDRKKFSQAIFLHDCGQMEAVKIRRGENEWTVKSDEVFELSAVERIKEDDFVSANKPLIDAWNKRKEGETKADIIRSLSIALPDGYAALTKADKYELLT